MPGAGTKTAITTNSPPTARVLDLTRLISRAGRIATGVDRVELAYLNQLLLMPAPCFALVRTRLGFVLLDKAGMQAVRDRVTGRIAWGAFDRLSWLARSYSQARKRAEADLRRLCLARCHRRGLRRMLQKHVPAKARYLNVGHSNLTGSIVSAFRRGLDAQISVLLHDTIPLDLPQFQRPETVRKFHSFLMLVSQQADLVICNSQDTQSSLVRITRQWGPVPRSIVAHLGTIIVAPDKRNLPKGLALRPPYFVIVGTIEPRKNHAFLLDIWDQLAGEYPADQVPQLVICGARGWNNEAVFNRLDQLKHGKADVLELTDLSDPALSAVMAGAAGALFPSFAEGFGLPASEAALAGIPLVCNDLPVFSEFLGDIPIYANVSDSYLWKTTIMDLAQNQEAGRSSGKDKPPLIELPTWEDHFNVVLNTT